MKLKNLRDVLIHQVKDIYFAEKQLVKALPKMERAASNPDLKEAFANHAEETQNHVNRLEEVFSLLGIPPKGEKCPAILGLIEEASEIITEDHEPEAGDAAIIASAQRVEHYEIAAYGCARAFAKRLGLSEIVTLLTATIEEEGAADQGLTALAEGGINDSAVTGEGNDESDDSTDRDASQDDDRARSSKSSSASANSMRETKPSTRNSNGRAPAKADKQTSARTASSNRQSSGRANGQSKGEAKGQFKGEAKGQFNGRSQGDSNGRSSIRPSGQPNSLSNGKSGSQRGAAADNANGKNGGRRKAAGSKRAHATMS